jgi:hypothetical protein
LLRKLCRLTLLTFASTTRRKCNCVKIVEQQLGRELVQIRFGVPNYRSCEVRVSLQHWRQWWLSIAFVNVWIPEAFTTCPEVVMPDSYCFSIFDMFVRFPFINSLNCFITALTPCQRRHINKSNFEGDR